MLLYFTCLAGSIFQIFFFKRNHLHLLTYNSGEVNTERTIEDLEMLDYEDQTKFPDWRIRKETTINLYRKL
jgi:hypothetical protein